MEVTAVILAAGRGTRMHSDLPKVLHEFATRPLIAYPIEAAVAAGAQRLIVVTGHGRREVEAVVERWVNTPIRLSFAHQPEQLGTGHAVDCARSELPDHGLVLILSGDVPLIRGATLLRLAEVAVATTAGLALATFRPTDPTGYGRVLRDLHGAVVAIREQKDATATELSTSECNAGTYAVEAERLHRWLPRLGRNNAQGEMYLTDLVAMAAAEGSVAAVEVDALEAAGVNTPEQLRGLEAHYLSARRP